MLMPEQNDLITLTGPEAPMGQLMRRYWVPALLSEEIPAPDSPPVQVKILGEELVAFRDSNGRIGLIAEHCSHRGTSLFYGRNENCGLTCIYHGWKYDVDGHVLDTPAEPAGSTFKDRLTHPAYATREVGGIVFAYLGPKEHEPLFPAYEWALVSTDHTYVTKAHQECNYLQGLEGECDSSHLSFLHRTLDRSQQALYMDNAPRYHTEDTDFGERLIALRDAPDGGTYVRVSAFLMPVACAVPVGGRDAKLDGFEVHFYTPIDDTHSLRFDFGFRRSRTIVPEDVVRRKVIDTNYQRIPNRTNHYLQDREMQRTVNFTGMADFLSHDSCATESMGARFDRSREHLGASDAGVIAVRRRMLEAVQAFQRGEPPLHAVTDPALNHFAHADSIAEVIEGTDWHAAFPHLVRSAAERPVVPEPAGTR
jgi:phenylpropionate dioxygenase-like ring-hydroxylating dioxygenase large terminal subunit